VRATSSHIAISAEWLLVLLLIAFSAGTLRSAWNVLHTDFPNYYTTARLVEERVDTTRAYEWLWMQRQKDHRSIEQPLIGLIPSTPLSTLIVYPLAGLPPLQAKHCWLVANAGLLLATIFLLTRLTRLPLRHIALLFALSIPLQRNFLLGQYYLLLLFLLTLAYWLQIREKKLLCGITIALATALKIFPVLYLVYFLRKKDWRALVASVASLALLAAVSIKVFGWQMNRIYLTQVLPPALRGEMPDPYNLGFSSISSLLRHLFIAEPQWNPHPVLHVPLLFAVLHPLLQMLVLVPMLLLIAPRRREAQSLEWSALLLASLAISTSPASYLFTLLILPVALLLDRLLQQKQWKAAAALILLYLIAGLPNSQGFNLQGWHALLAEPRLYALLLLCLFATLLLYQHHAAWNTGHRLWLAALALVLIANIVSGIRHQHGVYQEYAYRLSVPQSVMMERSAALDADNIHTIALVPKSYRAIMLGDNNISPGEDELSLAAGNQQLWVEHVGAHSTLVSASDTIADAESPILSPDGRQIAYLRERSGRARLWLHTMPDRPLTPPQYNVLEAAFAPNGSLIFSAMQSGTAPMLFLLMPSGTITPLIGQETRYPAISPDGHWLAYSRMRAGNWNLWLHDLQTGSETRLTNAGCNFIEPVWLQDAKTLLYASDCGRGIGFTALSRRRVIP